MNNSIRITLKSITTMFCGWLLYGCANKIDYCPPTVYDLPLKIEIIPNRSIPLVGEPISIDIWTPDPPIDINASLRKTKNTEFIAKFVFRPGLFVREYTGGPFTSLDQFPLANDAFDFSAEYRLDISDDLSFTTSDKPLIVIDAKYTLNPMRIIPKRPGVFFIYWQHFPTEEEEMFMNQVDHEGCDIQVNVLFDLDYKRNFNLLDSPEDLIAHQPNLISHNGVFLLKID